MKILKRLVIPLLVVGLVGGYLTSTDIKAEKVFFQNFSGTMPIFVGTADTARASAVADIQNIILNRGDNKYWEGLAGLVIFDAWTTNGDTAYSSDSTADTGFVWVWSEVGAYRDTILAASICTPCPCTVTFNYWPFDGQKIGDTTATGDYSRVGLILDNLEMNIQRADSTRKGQAATDTATSTNPYLLRFMSRGDE